MRQQQLYELVDVEKTTIQMGQKLQQRFQQDRSIDAKFDVSKFIQYVRDQVDPTENHQYTLWILRTYVKGGIRQYEDMSRTNIALKFFHTNKRQMTVKDINQIKQLPDLEQLVADTQPAEPSGKQIKRQQLDAVKNETEVFYSGPEGKILIPQSEAASCFWGQGTRWCTASSSSTNYFAQYSSQGPLYIILPNDGTKWQLHVASSQFLDAQDQEFDVESWSDNYPWAHNLLQDIYPALNPLHRLRDTLSTSAYHAEIENRAQATDSIPNIDGIEGDKVRLDWWNTLEDFTNEGGIEIDVDMDQKFDVDDVDIDTTPGFDQLLLSRLGTKTRDAIEHHYNLSSAEAVVTVIMEQTAMIKPIADVIEKHYSSTEDNSSTPVELATAVTIIVGSYLDEYSAYFIVDEKGGIGLYMDVDTFADNLDAEHDQYADETFAHHSYGTWLSTEHADVEIENIIAYDGAAGHNSEPYYQKEVAIINRVLNQGIPNKVTVTAVRDRDTKDMFGDEEVSTAVEITASVIDHVVANIRTAMRISEARRFNDILKTVLG